MKINIKLFHNISKNTLIYLLLHQIIHVFLIPKLWASNLYKIKIIFTKKGVNYFGFHPFYTINNLFYKTQLINLRRYGFNGVSSNLGLGKFKMSQFFHISYLSHYIFCNFGALTILLGTVFWVINHLIWIQLVNYNQVLFVIIILLFSSSTYAMAYVRQNYQILGWLWYPLILFNLYQENWIWVTILLFLVSIFNLTSFVFLIPIIIYFIFDKGMLIQLSVLLPGIIITMYRFYPLLKSKSLLKSLTNIAKLIGLKKNKVKYKRDSNKLSLFNFYFILLYLLGLILFYFSTNSFPNLAILGLIVFFVNQFFARIADEQSLIIYFNSLFVADLMTHEITLLSLLSLWIVSNPLGLFLTIQNLKGKDKKIDTFSFVPFNYKQFLIKIENFLKPINTNERIYFAFNDPLENYFKVFDGYRVIYEAPLYVASKNNFHIFPDWWAVGETNYKGAPQIWGRSLKDVLKNLDFWNAKYTIIYQKTGTKLEKKWKQDFELISELDWKIMHDNMKGFNLWNTSLPTPKWFLLKKR